MRIIKLVYMINLNFGIISGNTLGSMFFASTIFVTLVIARYGTLAKLIRDSRADIENKKAVFETNDEYIFHIAHYEKRLKLLKYTLFLSLFGGIALIISFLSSILGLKLFSAINFSAHLGLMFLSLISLVYELAVSFEALSDHLKIMKIKKIDKKLL